MTIDSALLVDGDNLSAQHAAEVLAIASRSGPPSVLRVYADMQRSDWGKAAGWRLMHAGGGKNAADLLLAIDAMELALLRGLRQFWIASSDGDFTHLALRLREIGAVVTGIGEAKAPASLRAACTAFVALRAEAPKPAQKPAAKPQVADFDSLIRSMIAKHGPKGQGMEITLLAARMRADHGTTISSRPERTWRAYLSKRPTLYDLDPRGPDAKVRFRPEGFRAAQQGAARHA